MVLTRSTTKKIESGRVTAHDPTEHPPALTWTKKRRRQASPAAPPGKKRCREPEECQLTRNLDVLVLIATYISPGDLLNLARTCTSIRELLMDKSSAFIWRACRRQVDGLPDCPVDLSEPEYAYLAFHPCCHSCGEHTEKIFWAFRRRYCARCRVKRLCTLSSFFREVIGKNRVIGTEYTTLRGRGGGSCDYVDKEQMESFMLEYLQSSNKKQFIEDKVKFWATLSKDIGVYRVWEMHEERKRRDELYARMQERKNSILERLKQLGFEREVTHDTSFRIMQSHNSFFYTSTLLTDEEWNQHLPALLVTMNKLRSQLETRD